MSVRRRICQTGRWRWPRRFRMCRRPRRPRPRRRETAYASGSRGQVYKRDPGTPSALSSRVRACVCWSCVSVECCPARARTRVCRCPPAHDGGGRALAQPAGLSRRQAAWTPRDRPMLRRLARFKGRSGGRGHRRIPVHLCAQTTQHTTRHSVRDCVVEMPNSRSLFISTSL